MLNEELAKTARYYKENPEGVKYMCKIIEEMRDEARQEGFEKGIEQGKEENLLQNVQNLMKSLKISAEQALDALMVPADQHDKYLAKMK